MITLISSLKNELKNISKFKKMMQKAVLISQKKKLFIKEIILCDNHSNDNTFVLLKKIKIKNVNIKILKNEYFKSDYGHGFTKCFDAAKFNYIMTIHSDLQFDLYEFIKNNYKELGHCIHNKINIFPKRINRSLFANFRSLILKIFLFFIFGRIFNDFNGQPKLIIKSCFPKNTYFPSNFSWDCFIYLFLKKKNLKLILTALL